MLAPVKGVGPKTALNGIRKHGTIEAYLKTLNTTKNPRKLRAYDLALPIHHFGGPYQVFCVLSVM